MRLSLRLMNMFFIYSRYISWTIGILLQEGHPISPSTKKEDAEVKDMSHDLAAFRSKADSIEI